MILTDEATRARHLDSGAWGTTTLDQLFRRAARAHPDRLALVDAPDRADWTSGEPQQLTYAEADRQISRIAALFVQFGLSTDQIVAAKLPNTATTLLVYLAAWRAGLIVVPLPLTWRRRSIRPALERIGARAIITVDALEGEDIATPMRDIAAELFGVRHLLGVGDALPEGIVDLIGTCDQLADDQGPPELERRENAADHVASLTFSGTADGRLVPVPRSHNQWISAGLMTMLEARMEPGCTIVSPFMPTGMAGLGGAVVPWLLSGGTLHLHHFRSKAGLADHLATLEPDHVLCPALLAAPVAGALDAAGSEAVLIAVWPGLHGAAPPVPPGPRTVIDLTVLDELALFARARDGDAPVPLPLGRIGAPSGADAPLELLELGRTELDPERDARAATHHLLVLRGPMAPAPAIMRSLEFVPVTAEGFLETSILVRVSGAPPTARPQARAGRLIMVGGLAVGDAEIDDAYADHEAVRRSALYVARADDVLPKIGLAIVPEHAAPFTAADASAHAAEAGLAEHARPQSLTRTASLPRKPSGELDRDALQSTLRIR